MLRELSRIAARLLAEPESEVLRAERHLLLTLYREATQLKKIPYIERLSREQKLELWNTTEGEREERADNCRALWALRELITLEKTTT